MPVALRKQFTLHAKKPALWKRIDTAKAVIAEFLQTCKTPYISVSGGKDSTVLLHIVRSVKRDIDALHIDMHCGYPETLALFETFENLYFIDVGNRLPRLQTDGMGYTDKQGKIRNFDAAWVNALGYTGHFYGLRCQEAKGRTRSFLTRGYSFQKKDGVWVCQPLALFTRNDIWAYIVHHNLPYNRIYNHLWDEPERRQRVADFALVKSAVGGSIGQLKRTHPHLFNQIVIATKEFREYL